MIEMNQKALAQRVGTCMRQARGARGWTQERVAASIGISVKFYGRVERGQALPSMETFLDLLLLFGLSPSAVLEGADVSTATPVGDAPLLRRIATRLRRASPRTIALINELLDGLDALRDGKPRPPP